MSRMTEPTTRLITADESRALEAVLTCELDAIAFAVAAIKGESFAALRHDVLSNGQKMLRGESYAAVVIDYMVGHWAFELTEARGKDAALQMLADRSDSLRETRQACADRRARGELT